VRAYTEIFFFAFHFSILRHLMMMMMMMRVERVERKMMMMMMMSRRRFSTTKVWMGSYEVPKTGKKNPKGEDVFFIRDRSAAVFDGVGGWYRHNVDPRRYPEDLSQCIEMEIESRGGFVDNLESVIRSGWEKTKEPKGSCTCCAFALGKNNRLQIYNIGDSGLILIRDDKILTETKVQESMFNMPYQLGPKSRQKPSDGEVTEIEVRNDDVVIMATDGLFGNLSNDEILAFLKSVKTFDPNTIAKDLTMQAHFYSRDTRRPSPHTQRAWDLGFDEYYGGKRDDITVVVAKIIIET
jgi:protein phosphatase PTC7